MVLVEHQQVAQFLASAGDFLRAREVENAYLLGVLESPKGEVPTLMAEVRRGSEILLAACYRGANLLLARAEPSTPEGMELIVKRLQQLRVNLPGVVGPAGEAELFARSWSKVRRCSAALVMDQLIYRLTEVVNPETPPPGQARPAGPDDLPLLAEWVYRFHHEALPREAFSRHEARQNAQERVVAESGTWVWEVEGRAVAMAALTRPTARGIMVNAVYTPPDQRRRGYAGALVAALSSEGLRRGKHHCVLYTDVTNLTSNGIYQKIGYRSVCNFRNYQFRYR